MAMLFGLLGRGFGFLGAARFKGGGTSPAPTFPVANSAANFFLIIF